ncbi:putative transcription factor interactor and regulator CCHC(Zn) family [Helianthus debilis subsp. tardiflorus]
MIFVLFTGIDNHHRNVTFGAGLLSSETADSYRWLLGTFLKSFGVAPKVVVTDQDPAMKVAIRDIFPDSRHRLCMWHIMKKIADKVGIKLSSDNVFKRRLCDIVWTDAIDPDVFERFWSEIMIDYSLNSNKWFSDMFQIRSDWIPAYYRHELMSGLMRTTSRSESENHFFGQLTNTKLSLVEFLCHFDTAIDSQRFTHRKNDHDTRDTTPEMSTSYELEPQADKIYTREIFWDVQGEIHSSVYECASKGSTPAGDFEKFYIEELDVDVSEPYYEVLFRKMDMEITCSCKRYEQYGLLCRHIFCVLRISRIKEFPAKYVMKRWTRDAVPRKSMCSFINRDGDNVERAESIIRDIMYSNEYIVNRVANNIDQLSSYRDQLKDVISKVDASYIVSVAKNKNERFSNIFGVEKPSSKTIKRPTGIKTKGSGSRKRLMSFRELASVQKKKKTRVCLICKMPGHNSRSCSQFKDFGVGSSKGNPSTGNVTSNAGHD